MISDGFSPHPRKSAAHFKLCTPNRVRPSYSGVSAINPSVLWLLMLSLFAVLPAERLPAEDEAKSAKDDDTAKAEEKVKQVVAVFRLKGGLSETPTDETFPFGGEQSTALKDLVQRMQKAA